MTDSYRGGYVTRTSEKPKAKSSMYALMSEEERAKLDYRAQLAAERKAAADLRKPMTSSEFTKPTFTPHTIDWAHMVSLDFETYWDANYTLKKMSTSEYVRDKRFKAQMMGIKVGHGKTKIIPAARIRAELAKIDWASHSLLCHNTQFDGFILSHHYGVHPAFLYDSLAMARGLHSNDIGAGLDEVSVFYGGTGKTEGGLDGTLGVVNWPKPLFDKVAVYCANDVDEMVRVFKEMAVKLPDEEFRLIDMITRMFTSPVLKVDIPRVEKELVRELDLREKLMYAAVTPTRYEEGGDLFDKNLHKKLLKGPEERALTGVPRDMQIIKRVIGSNELFAQLLRDEDIEPPLKVSDAWMKRSAADRADETDKYTYAFAKDDTKFINLPNDVESWGFNLENPDDVQKMAIKQARLQALVDVRIAVKSTTNITRAERFLEAGRDGAPLPVGYAYYRAHTGRLGGNNKMNMQNLQRGGELRLSILAPKGHQIAVVDSGQIEARVNAWLWGQNELLRAFRTADLYEAKQALLPEEMRRHATGDERDAYCIFADTVYPEFGKEVTKANKTERFVGKVCVLGLGYQMGAPKFQITLAKGALGGPPVFFPEARCKNIVNSYRERNYMIVRGWGICEMIIKDMAAGRRGSHGGILNWEKDTLWLPNGMCLKYPDIRNTSEVEDGRAEWTYRSGDMRKKIYGGLLCENIVQALARIIVMWQMLEIGKRYRCVMTTHDEVAALVKTSQAKTAFAYMMKCMTVAPDWCSTIPLNAEGGYASNYSK